MKAHRNNLMSLIPAVFGIAGLLATPPTTAVTRCGTFEIVPIPGTASRVVALDDGSAWAVGSSAENALNPTIFRFEGGAWSHYDVPNNLNGFAFGAAGKTPDGDAWFAGTRSYTVYEIEVVFMRMRGGIIDRIDIFPYAGHNNRPSAPIDISASSANDVWALTSSGDVIHFDGSSWQPIDVPQPFTVQRSIHPAGIHVIGPDDVWTAGSGGPGRADYIGYTQHWNGSSWSNVATPYDGQGLTFFRDIDGSGPDDIWISGHSNYSKTIQLHWDGANWIQSPAPASDAPMDEVLAMEPDNAWSLPYSLSDPHFYYWNGIRWQEGSTFNIPSATTVNWYHAAKAGNCDAWAVGAYYDGSAYQSLAARLTPGEVQPEVFVHAIDVSRVRSSGKSYIGKAEVTVLDEDRVPVAGVLVSGNFSGPSGESLVATTGADGKAVFSSEPVYRPDTNWCFTVSNVEAVGSIYSGSLNIETSDCEAATSGGGGKGGGKGR